MNKSPKNLLEWIRFYWVLMWRVGFGLEITRLPRGIFWILRLSIVVVWLVACAAIMGIASAIAHTSSIPPFVQAVLIAWSIICGIIALRASIDRMHDVNVSGWPLILYIVPFANCVAAFYCLVKFLEKGDQGKNDYGEPLNKATLSSGNSA